MASLLPQPVTQLRLELARDRAALKDDYRKNPNPARALAKHANLIDRTLRSVWRDTRMPDELALVAVGGYGRGELYPHSDIDVLVLLPSKEHGALRQQLETFVTLLWDMGLEIGHSVRSIDECLSEGERDVTVQTTLLEARQLIGSARLFEQFQQRYRAHLKPAAFWDAKLLELRRRHLRFFETAYNLEPNVKESPGGLRDLQTVLWLARAAGVGGSWRELAQAGLITLEEARRIKRDERALQSLRIRLHYLADRREDRLLFDHQSALAAELGIERKSHWLPSEMLMRHYYRTAKDVGLSANIVLQNLAHLVHPERDATLRRLNQYFRRRGDLLELIDAQTFEREPDQILEAFRALQQQPDLSGMTAQTQRALWRARPRLDAKFRAKAQNRTRFMAILRDARRVTFVLRLMNQYGVMARYLPLFGRIVGQMQHDGYHVYTVDEHILKVLRNVRRFAVADFNHEFPFCSSLMQAFPRPEVLYLAALFHDIAKGRGGDHSSLGSVDARRFCQQHQLSEEDTDLVAWLVEKHLVMSATAQKQDLGDPEVIRAFATTVASERRLVALYLLTVADIRGTSPKVWNAWKAKLLEDLFRAARRFLGGQPDLDAELHAKKSEALRIVRQYALTDGVHEALWKQLDDAYFTRHAAQEIAWHTRLLRGKVDSATPIVRARLSPGGEGVQVMIFCPDREGLFARICGFFDRVNFDIVEAKIHTTRHGYALDSFQVLDRSGSSQHYRDFLNYIEHELGERLRTQAPFTTPVRGRISRQQKHFPIVPTVEIEAERSRDCYSLSFVAGDRSGLLYAVALVFLNHGLSVLSAKINTLGERAEDTFLVAGASLDDPHKRDALRADLLATLQLPAPPAGQ